MNKEKQLRLIKPNDNIELIKGEKDNIFYDKNNDNIEYYFAEPYIKIWTNASGTFIKTIKINLDEAYEILKQHNPKLNDFLQNEPTPTKCLVDPYFYKALCLRIPKLDTIIENKTFYAWVDINDPEKIKLTVEDYDLCPINTNSEIRNVSGRYITDEITGNIIGVEATSNYTQRGWAIYIIDYAWKTQYQDFGIENGKKIKTQNEFYFNLENNTNKLTKIEIYGITFLYDSLKNNTNLHSAIIHEGTVDMDETFDDCINLTELYFPSTLTFLSLTDFSNVSNVTTIYWNNNVDDLDKNMPTFFRNTNYSGLRNLEQIVLNDIILTYDNAEQYGFDLHDTL